MKKILSRLFPTAMAAGLVLFTNGCFPDSSGPTAAELEAIRQADEAQLVLEETRAAYDWQAAEVEKRSAELDRQLALMEAELRERKDAEMQQRLEAMREENERLRLEGERARQESERISRQVEEIRRATPVTMPVAHHPSELDGMFRERLQPYGDWVSVGGYGDCWRPSLAAQPEWRPYLDGSWAWSDQGWSWLSNEPFGWAVYHYGRWVRVARHGWVWVPGSEWAPAWVAWRSGDSHIGWAPLPPEPPDSVWTGVGSDCDSRYRIQPVQYVFVPVARFVAPTYVNACVPRVQVTQVYSTTVNVTNIVRLDHDGGRRGPSHGHGGVYGHGGGPDRNWIGRQTHAAVPSTRPRLADGSMIEARLDPEMRHGPRAAPEVVRQSSDRPGVVSVPVVRSDLGSPERPSSQGRDRLEQGTGMNGRGRGPREESTPTLSQDPPPTIPGTIQIERPGRATGSERVVSAIPVQTPPEQVPQVDSIRPSRPAGIEALRSQLPGSRSRSGPEVNSPETAPVVSRNEPAEQVPEVAVPQSDAPAMDAPTVAPADTAVPSSPSVGTSRPSGIDSLRGQLGGARGRPGPERVAPEVVSPDSEAALVQPTSEEGATPASGPGPMQRDRGVSQETEVPAALAPNVAPDTPEVADRAADEPSLQQGRETERMANEQVRQQAIEAQQMAQEAAASRAAEEQMRQQQAMEAQKTAEEAARRGVEEQAQQQVMQEKREAEEQAMEAQRASEETARRVAEEQTRQQAMEAQRAAEEQARQQAMEAQRVAEEATRRAAEEQARQQAMEAQRAAEEAARRAAEEQARQQAMEAQRAAEEQARQQAMEAQRAAEEAARRAAEEQARQQAMEAQRAAEEAARRAAEEQARQQAMEAQRAAEEAARRAAEEQMRRQAEEAQRQAQEAAQRAAEEAARRAAEEQARQQAMEAQRAAEEAAHRAAEEAARQAAGQ